MNPAAREAAKAAAAGAKKAAGDKKAAAAATPVDDNIGAFCSVDRKPRSLGEKEQDFLMALQSFYDTGTSSARRHCTRPGRAGQWHHQLLRGLSLCVLLLPAPGKPSMSNEEFDVLKQELLWEGSQVAILSKDEQVRR